MDMTLEISYVGICIYMQIFLPDLVMLHLLNSDLWPLSQKVLIMLRLAGYGESVKITDHVIGSVGRCVQKHFW